MYVAAAIEDRQKALAGKLEITQEAVLAELAKIAFAPFGHDHIATSDKRAALVDLGKHLGMFVDHSQVDASIKIIADRPMTADEWAAEYAANYAEHAAVAVKGAN